MSMTYSRKSILLHVFFCNYINLIIFCARIYTIRFLFQRLVSSFRSCSFFKDQRSWVQSPFSRVLEVVLFQGSSFLCAMSMPSLVRRKWSKILYLGVNFELNLVLETPGLTEAARIDILSTKSSELNVQCAFGFNFLEFTIRCWNVWCFITMWNNVIPFSRAHAEG